MNYHNLPYLSRNKTGYGYLIENDGYIAGDKTGKSLKENLSITTTNNILNLDNPVVYAVLQKCDVENRNGRIYPKDILEREVEKYQESIELRSATGEADHPESSTVSTNNVAILITKTWWVGCTLMGEIYLPITRGFKESGICSTAADRVANLIVNNVQIGISSRGVGSVKNVGGKNEVQKDFELICWDVVSCPSTKGSWIFPELDKTKPYVTMHPEISNNTKAENAFKKGTSPNSGIFDFLKNIRK